MKFEEALSELRKGKKIRHPSFEEDVYLSGCYIGMPGEAFESCKDRRMSIVKCLGDKQHPDMRPNPNMHPKFKRECESDLHFYPQLNLLLLMRDDWEAFE